MKLFQRGPLSAVLCSLAAAVVAYGAAATIDPGRYLDDIKFLASQDMKGRATGTPELEKAAAYIAADFRSFGLQPIDGKSYYQAFSVTTHARLGKDNRFAYTIAGKRVKLNFPEDFIPFNFSARAKMSGPVVFAGYGITAPEYNYDDYAGVDVTGKIVLIFRHEPKEGSKLSDHSAFTEKAVNAKMHGA